MSRLARAYPECFDAYAEALRDAADENRKDRHELLMALARVQVAQLHAEEMACAEALAEYREGLA